MTLIKMVQALRSIRDWLRKSWYWVAGGVGALLAIVLFSRRKTAVEVPSKEAERRDIDREATEEVAEAREARDEKTEDLVKSYNAEVRDATAEHQKVYDKVKGDPEELQEWLLELGRIQRKEKK